MKRNTKKITLVLLSTICLFVLTCVAVFATGTEETEAPTMTAQFVEFLKQNKTSLFSGLAALSSIILGFSFRKSLLPLIRKALEQFVNALKGGLQKANDSVEKLQASSDAQLKALADLVAPMLEKANVALEQSTASQEKLSLLEKTAADEQKSREVLSTVLTAQMDMFYQFFMSVNLPQYQKDKLGEMYLQMQKKITDASHEHKEPSEEVSEDA